MRNWSKEAWLCVLAAVLSLCLGVAVRADDGKNGDTAANGSNTPAASDNAAGKKADKPAEAGLTDRERMLLDRVEELERRVTELEATRNGSTAAQASPGIAETVPQGIKPSESDALVVGAKAPASSNPPLIANVPVLNSAPSTAVTSVAPSGEASSSSSIGPRQEQAVAAEKPAKAEPFAFADWTWLNGNARTKEVPLDTKFFTPEIRADVSYIYDFNHPKDDTIGGSSEVFRSSEFQLTQLGVGGDFHYDNVRARLMTQFGMYSETTPRNDASPARGQWNLDGAYRYISEAYGGYHFDVLHGVNVDAGIFMSYIGLFSYYNFDNWAYQPSFVSSNTPWFFNGLRVQILPSEHLKIEPWVTNGWQSYGRFNNRPGLGMQILWRPNGWFSILGNQYAMGTETLGNQDRIRYHSDDSIEVKYYDHPEKMIDKMAFSLTGDIGCEHGGGVSCWGGSKKGPKQSFLGYMFYNRVWFDRDRYALTLGGGRINNPGRYLVLLPPINGATAATGTPYFTENPGDKFKAWDGTATFDYMPSQYITFRWEFNHRAANVPYWTGPGGITPPGGNNGSPGSQVCSDGSVAPASGCGALGLWQPDLKKIENRINMAILVKF